MINITAINWWNELSTNEKTRIYSNASKLSLTESAKEIYNLSNREIEILFRNKEVTN